MNWAERIGAYVVGACVVGLLVASTALILRMVWLGFTGQCP